MQTGLPPQEAPSARRGQRDTSYPTKFSPLRLLSLPMRASHCRWENISRQRRFILQAVQRSHRVGVPSPANRALGMKREAFRWNQKRRKFVFLKLNIRRGLGAGLSEPKH